MEPYRSVYSLKGRATRLHPSAIPRTSPSTIHSAWKPTAYPIPVRPRRSQALSPVALLLKAMTQEGSCLSAT